MSMCSMAITGASWVLIFVNFVAGDMVRGEESNLLHLNVKIGRTRQWNQEDLRPEALADMVQLPVPARELRAVGPQNLKAAATAMTDLLVSHEAAQSDPVYAVLQQSRVKLTHLRLVIFAVLIATTVALVFTVSIRNDSKAKYFSVAAAPEPLFENPSEFACGPALPELRQALASGWSVTALIAASCSANPQKAAVLDSAGNVCLTYNELGLRVNALAGALHQSGLNRGDIVALILKPSAALLVSALGTMHCGLAWAPLDGDTPEAWRQGQLDGMGSRLQLVAEDRRGLLHAENTQVPMWFLDLQGNLIDAGQGRLPQPSPPRAVSNHVDKDTVFIIHTSGSTGRPKGVLYSGATLLHGVLSWKNTCQMDGSTVALMKTPATWAVTEYELFPALIAGGSIVADWECQRNFARLARVLVERKISVLVTSAPVLRLLTDDFWSRNGGAPQHLYHIMNVGAGIPLAVCAKVGELLGDKVSVHNVYGCTETPCCAWTFRGDKKLTCRDGLAPAGLPQPEVEVRLLDAQLREVAANESGEICFAGQFLASGYLDQELTKARFQRNPFGRGTMYKSGDLGRWVRDPTDPRKLAIQVIGRKDRQTNINGIRVAPEDVEVPIRDVPGVKDVAVVIAEGEGVPPCLVACVSAGSGDHLETPVKSHCAEQLPKHMCPAIVLQLSDFPKLPNGKVDMKQLSKHASEMASKESNVAPDSLGLVRKAGKDALQESDTMAAARGIGMLLVILYHWYYMPVAWTDMPLVHAQFPYPSVLFIHIGVGMNWCMQLFVITSAYQDRLSGEQNLRDQWRGDLFVFIVYLFMHGILSKLLTAMLYFMSGSTITGQIGPFTGTRWYFYFYLICRGISQWCFVPIRNLLKSEGEVCVAMGSTVLIGFAVAVAWLGDQEVSDGKFWRDVPDACRGLRQDSFLAGVIAWFMPGSNVGPGTAMAYCPFVPHQSMLWYIAIYTVAWWYGTTMVRHFKTNMLSVSRILDPILAGVAILITVVCVYYLEQYEWMISPPKPPMAWFMVYIFDLFIAAAVILTLAIAIHSGVLHNLGLVFMGRYSMGSYVLHAYMFGQMGMLTHLGVPDVVTAVQYSRGFPGAFIGTAQLAVFLLYPFLFMLTLGPLFQMACLSLYNCSIQLVSELVRPTKRFPVQSA